MSENILDVCVGVLVNVENQLLFAQRPIGKPYAGYWEFPGGKVEKGESVFESLQRELKEECGLVVHSANVWRCVEHVYPHAHVRLHFFITRDFSGQLQSLEGQEFVWAKWAANHASPLSSMPHPILPATLPLLDDLQKAVEETSVQ